MTKRHASIQRCGLLVETVPLSSLREDPRNARKHGAANLKAIADSLRHHGQVEPLVVQKSTGLILGGNGRLAAMKTLGWKTAQVVRIDVEGHRARALALALNRTAELAEWDLKMLADTLQEIDTGEFDVAELTGFDASELERIANWAPEGDVVEDEAPPPPKTAVSKTGDLWILGRHRILCGDSTSEEDVKRLMDGKRAGLMNTDPPYGVAYANDDRPNPWVAKPRSGKTQIANDDLCDAKLQSFLESAFRAANSSALRLNAAWYLWHAHLTQGFFAAAAAAADVMLHRQIVWVKPAMLLTRGQYHWRHEPCFFGWVRGHQPPDYGAGKGERNQTTVWEIGGVTQADRKEFNHATPKPVGLFSIPIAKHLMLGEIAYEPFAGSGSQIIAAEQLGRRCYAIEIEPRYVDVCVARWQNATSKRAKNETRPSVVLE